MRSVRTLVAHRCEGRDRYANVACHVTRPLSTDRVGATHNENPDRFPNRVIARGVDWRIDHVFTQRIPADADLELRLRRNAPDLTVSTACSLKPRYGFLSGP